VIALIPARGGSKRIPGKNIKLFAGKPIIQYSIDAAIQSGLFKRIIVSTDSEEIATVAESLGAEAPFRRPGEIAGDHAALSSVILHAINSLGLLSAPEPVCCLFATAPFVTPESLRAGVELLQSSGASTVFPVTTFPYPILRALKVAPDHTFSMFWPEHEKSRSNDLPEAYHDAGQFYWVEPAKFSVSKRLFNSDSRVFVLPRSRVQDLDTVEDWRTAELAFKAWGQLSSD
jgi:pseudaminic acid cytidylyltransferase